MNARKRLQRSEHDKWIGGVCGGIAEYLDWDPTLIRLAWLVATIFSAGFPGFYNLLVPLDMHAKRIRLPE